MDFFLQETISKKSIGHEQAGLKVKKNCKSSFGVYQRKNWSPNAKCKMQLPDSTRTETQIGASLN